MIKTYKELNQIDRIVGELYEKNIDLKKSKFGYAYKRFYEKNLLPILKEFKENIDEIRVNNALEDKTTKEVLIDRESNWGYKFSKDGLKAVMKAEKELLEKLNEKEIEVVPFISTFVPEDLDEEQTEQLKGLLID